MCIKYLKKYLSRNILKWYLYIDFTSLNKIVCLMYPKRKKIICNHEQDEILEIKIKFLKTYSQIEKSIKTKSLLPTLSYPILRRN